MVGPVLFGLTIHPPWPWLSRRLTRLRYALLGEKQSVRRQTSAVRGRLRFGAIIAEREYEWRTARGRRRIVLRLGAPERDPLPGGDWLCPVQFAGAPAECGLPRGVRPIYGIDGVQALSLALGYAQRELRALQRSSRGALTWLGTADLGLPDLLGLVGVNKVFRAPPRLRPTPRNPE